MQLSALVGALLFARTLNNLVRLDAGFRPDGILIAQVNTQHLKLPNPERAAIFQQLLARLRTAPQAASVARALNVPVGGSNFWNDNVRSKSEGSEKEWVLGNFNKVSGEYFRTMGTPLPSGRDFDERDSPSSSKVAIVDETFVRKVLNGRNPIGTRFERQVSPNETAPTYEIIGVVRDTKYLNLRDEFAPTAYTASTQPEQDESVKTSVTFVMRSNSSPGVLVEPVKEAVSETNPSLSLKLDVFSATLNQSLLRERLMTTLSSFFALLAALLAIIGIYGMLSYAVAQRRNEIGIRMALGADQARVVRMILSEALLLLVVGLTLGTIVALLTAKAAESFLFGLRPNDPVTIAAAISGLAAVALGASYLPARRAAKLEPATVLKEE